MKVHQDLLHIHIGDAVRRTAVNVVSVLVFIENKDADIRNGTEIDEVQNSIRDETLIDQQIEKVLNQS